MKAPYVTHSTYFKRYISTVSEGKSHIKNVCDNIYRRQCAIQGHPCYEIPYMMLQQRVTNNDEAKLCFLNKKFSHFVSGSSTVQSFRGYSQHDLILFAYQCLQSLANLSHIYIFDGLVRVDLFKDDQGLLVLNEIESLEAGCQSSLEQKNCQTNQFLINYWYHTICDSITCLGAQMEFE